MARESESRRAFLKGAAAGASAGAAAALISMAEARAAEAETATQPRPSGEIRGTFLNEAQMAAVTAFTERLMPGAPGKPGATEAGVANYIDLALAGAYADQQEFYRAGLNQLDAYCAKIHGAGFAALDAQRQDAAIAALEDGKADGFAWPAARAFFDTLRTHTMEGMFADPVYGGNKDFAGWRLVGFPGAQLAFTAADLKSSQPPRVAMIGLQAKRKS